MRVFINTENDWSGGIAMLAADITAGLIPDIFITDGLPYAEYSAKGLFTDIYGFIEESPDYDRNNFIEDAFRAFEIDGKLYQIFPNFTIDTILGHPDMLGEEPGWSIEKFINTIEAHPEADIQASRWMTKLTLLRSAIALSINEYINWDAGEAYFDTDEFVQLLEHVGRYPGEVNWTDLDFAAEPEVYWR